MATKCQSGACSRRFHAVCVKRTLSRSQRRIIIPAPRPFAVRCRLCWMGSLALYQWRKTLRSYPGSWCHRIIHLTVPACSACSCILHSAGSSSLASDDTRRCIFLRLLCAYVPLTSASTDRGRAVGGPQAPALLEHICLDEARHPCTGSFQQGAGGGEDKAPQPARFAQPGTARSSPHARRCDEDCEEGQASPWKPEPPSNTDTSTRGAIRAGCA